MTYLAPIRLFGMTVMTNSWGKVRMTVLWQAQGVHMQAHKAVRVLILHDSRGLAMDDGLERRDHFSDNHFHRNVPSLSGVDPAKCYCLRHDFTYSLCHLCVISHFAANSVDAMYPMAEWILSVL